MELTFGTFLRKVVTFNPFFLLFTFFLYFFPIFSRELTWSHAAQSKAQPAPYDTRFLGLVGQSLDSASLAHDCEQARRGTSQCRRAMP